MNVLNRIRAWIDAKDHRPLIAAILIIEAPVVLALLVLCIWLGAPWFTLPAAIVAALLVWGWLAVAMAALTRWFG